MRATKQFASISPIASIVIALICVATAMALVLAGDTFFRSTVISNPLLLVEILLVIILSIGPLFFFTRNTPLISLRTGVSLIFVLLFGLWPLGFMLNLDVSAGYLSKWVFQADGYFLQALLFAIFGIVSFHLGYLSPIGSRIAKNMATPSRPWNAKQIAIVSLISTVACFLSMVAVWNQLGSLARLVALFGQVKVQLDGYHYLTQGASLLRISILIAWAYSISNKFPRWIVWAQLILYTVFNIALGGRNQIISLWIMMYLINVLLVDYRISFRRILSGVTLVVSAIFLLVIVRSFRTSNSVSPDIAWLILNSFQNSWSTIFTTILREFDQLEVFSTVLAITPNYIPFWNGQSYLDIFTLPIPRSLWPGKPIPARLILGQLMRNSDTGIPITMIGEFYINFGVYGIIPGMTLFGALCRGIDQWAYNNRRNPTVVIIFVYLLTNLPVILTRYFYGWFGAILIFMSLFWLIIRFVSASPESDGYSQPARQPMFGLNKVSPNIEHKF